MRAGVVVIGRNEGERLRRCLASVAGAGCPVVYVDSGSTDGSVELARSVGVEVVELDLGTPFTAARARNAGRQRLGEMDDGLGAIQMLDGDCELFPGWLETGVRALEADAGLGVVWGRVRERDPGASVYNRLCDLEWDTPVGESTWFAGNALIRAAAFDAVGGYDSGVIAGEEPDMAWRLRRLGWRIARLDADVAWHDAAIMRLSQWWKRSVRAGHAHIDMAARHGWRVQPCNPRRVVTTLGWSIAGPVATVVLALGVSAWWWLLLLAYPVQWGRIAVGAARAGRRPRDAALQATFIMLAKWAETQGYGVWLARRLRRTPPTIIEYKAPPASAG